MRKKTYIYGAGENGKILACYLVECKRQKVDAILVSRGHRELDFYQTPKSLSGTVIPIIELEEKEGILNNSNCYITLIADKEEVIEKCCELGVMQEDVIDICPKIGQYRNEFFELYLKSLGINIDEEILTVGDVKLINFMKNQTLRGVFEGTVCDEIMPQIYNDCSLTVDGPYIDVELGVTLNEGDYVVDVGANLGLFSCYAAQLGCHVYACDPDETCIDILEEQSRLYPNSIEVVPYGLSDKVGEEIFYESDCCSISSIYMPRGNVKEKKIQVNSIDNLVANGTFQKVDYIKADIEGAERYMLKGAMETLKTQAPKLSICTYHYKDDPVVLESIIKEANPDYVISHSWRKLYAYVPAKK